MVLKRLEIQGFKSFPDRIKIEIQPGITAIVGPNGSGKSNISDAIRWVLGETSSRQLRGSGKMEDVIFGGTQQRGAMGFASVVLTVDNTDRRLDIDENEVAIGRRYYRSGESEYTLNGQAVRLKDIYEILLDTGLGRDGYSIIGQGRIAEIVGAKNTERREIFEEASEISKYRYRKNEAERRLSMAEDNLERLRDILEELKKRVGPLENECARANQFLNLSAKRREFEITLWMDSMRHSRDVVREKQRQYEMKQIEYNQLNERIDLIDQENDGLREEIQQISIKIEQYNIEIREITTEISGADSQIAVLENDISHNKQTQDNLRIEQKQASLGNEKIKAQIYQHQLKIKDAEGKIVQLEAKIQMMQKQFEKIQFDSAQLGERRETLTAAMADMTRRQTDIRVAVAAHSSTVQTSQQRLESLLLDQQKTIETLDRRNIEQKENGEYLANLTTNSDKLNNVKRGILLKLEKRRVELKHANDFEVEITRSVESADNRMRILQDLETNMDGYQQSVKIIVKASKERRLIGVLGTVSSLLTVKNGYETAIETALGYTLQNIVIDSENNARIAIKYLKDTRGGRATFLPLDTVRGQTFTGHLSGSAVAASNLVNFDIRYKGIVNFLLGRVIVVDDLNEASKVARELNYRYRVVTVDGQIINAGGSFTGGSMARSAGIFSRRQEIATLKQKLIEFKKKQENAHVETNKCKSEVDALTAELAAVESKLTSIVSDKIRAEMIQDQLNDAIAQLSETSEQIKSEIKVIKNQIEEEKEKSDQMQEENQHISLQIKNLADELMKITSGDDSFLKMRTRLSDDLNSIRMERLNLENEISLNKAAISALESRTDESEQRKVDIQHSLQALEDMNTQHFLQIERVRLEKQNCLLRIKKKESDIHEATSQRLAKEQSSEEKSRKIREISDLREKLSREMARLIEHKANAETEYDQMVAKLWEEYQLTQTQAQEFCVEFNDLSELQRQTAEIRNQIRELGNVNVGSIEEYKDVKKRYDFLFAQVLDVEKSREELLRLISELKNEMQNIFTNNFQNINLNFRKIFKEMFGGGDACLQLSDPENVLESGIDITVAPPGKVIKNLAALSGGEQAMVAICIYFAIMAVNPAPFCVLDEIEAALDDVNVARFSQYLRKISDKTQFIVITHRRGTMESADILYGVTMQEDGVSKLLRLDPESVSASLVC